MLVGIESASISDEVDDAEKDFLVQFRKKLLESITDRFTKDKEKGQNVVTEDGTIRRIKTVDVFHDLKYILATILDPRIKDAPFTGEKIFIVIVATI